MTDRIDRCTCDNRKRKCDACGELEAERERVVAAAGGEEAYRATLDRTVPTPNPVGHDSDFFDGLCPCTEIPCQRAYTAMRRLNLAERKRERVIRAYYDHHGEWPQSSFIDAVLAAAEPEISLASDGPAWGRR